MATSYQPSDGSSSDDGIVAEINITPLTDVFLVLLVIFMVTSSVIANTGKKVDLPEAVQQTQTPPQAIMVTLTADDIVQVNDKVVKLEDLRAHLEVALASAEEKMVILRGDKRVLLGQAVNILDLAQQAGATGIALATQPPAPEKG